MPPIAVIIWERRSRLAVDARRLLADVPAKVMEVRDEREFRAALQAASFPIVVLDRTAAGDKLPDALIAAAMTESWTVVVGPGSADEKRRDRDLGANLLLADVPDRLVWGGTLRRLVRLLRGRTGRSSGNRETASSPGS